MLLLVVLVLFLGFSSPEQPQFLSALLFLFQFSDPELLIHCLYLYDFISCFPLWISIFFYLNGSMVFIRLDLRPLSFLSVMLEYPGLAVVGELGSDGAILPWLLLIMFLHWSLATWLSLAVGWPGSP